ncbi:MAG: hypothetical protein SGI99_13595 [Pseudomonadota bacterium]|mgnify:CR=1 FL=1|nr:hypothetical protein [Pseudomonadota bacterium]
MPSETQRFIAATHKHPTWPRVYCLGDSWFQYPLKSIDLQKQIERIFRKEALFFNNSVPGRESAKIKALLPKMRDQLGAWEFDLLLVSMGGNDIVGDELAEFVKPANEPQSPGSNWPTPVPAVVDRHIRLKAFGKALGFVIDDMARVIELRNSVAGNCHILINTYDYPFASGRGYKIGPIKRGPWLKKYFAEVGLTEFNEQNRVATWLIDQFVDATQKLERSHVRIGIVDSRGTLPALSDWGNEIHPTELGFKRLAEQRWAPLIQSVLGLG